MPAAVAAAAALERWEAAVAATDLLASVAGAACGGAAGKAGTDGVDGMRNGITILHHRFSYHRPINIFFQYQLFSVSDYVGESSRILSSPNAMLLGCKKYLSNSVLSKWRWVMAVVRGLWII